MINSTSNSIKMEPQVQAEQFEALEQISKKNDQISSQDAQKISEQVLVMSADKNLSKDKISTLITIIDKITAAGVSNKELENAKLSLQMKLSDPPAVNNQNPINPLDAPKVPSNVKVDNKDLNLPAPNAEEGQIAEELGLNDPQQNIGNIEENVVEHLWESGISKAIPEPDLDADYAAEIEALASKGVGDIVTKGDNGKKVYSCSQEFKTKYQIFANQVKHFLSFVTQPDFELNPTEVLKLQYSTYHSLADLHGLNKKSHSEYGGEDLQKYAIRFFEPLFDSMSKEERVAVLKFFANPDVSDFTQGMVTYANTVQDSYTVQNSMVREGCYLNFREMADFSDRIATGLLAYMTSHGEISDDESIKFFSTFMPGWVNKIRPEYERVFKAESCNIIKDIYAKIADSTASNKFYLDFLKNGPDKFDFTKEVKDIKFYIGNQIDHTIEDDNVANLMFYNLQDKIGEFSKDDLDTIIGKWQTKEAKDFANDYYIFGQISGVLSALTDFSTMKLTKKDLANFTLKQYCGFVLSLNKKGLIPLNEKQIRTLSVDINHDDIVRVLTGLDYKPLRKLYIEIGKKYADKLPISNEAKDCFKNVDINSPEAVDGFLNSVNSVQSFYNIGTDCITNSNILYAFTNKINEGHVYDIKLANQKLLPLLAANPMDRQAVKAALADIYKSFGSVDSLPNSFNNWLFDTIILKFPHFSKDDIYSLIDLMPNDKQAIILLNKVDNTTIFSKVTINSFVNAVKNEISFSEEKHSLFDSFVNALRNLINTIFGGYVLSLDERVMMKRADDFCKNNISKLYSLVKGSGTKISADEIRTIISAMIRDANPLISEDNILNYTNVIADSISDHLDEYAADEANKAVISAIRAADVYLPNRINTVNDAVSNFMYMISKSADVDQLAAGLELIGQKMEPGTSLEDLFGQYFATNNKLSDKTIDALKTILCSPQMKEKLGAIANMDPNTDLAANESISKTSVSFTKNRLPAKITRNSQLVKAFWNTCRERISLDTDLPTVVTDKELEVHMSQVMVNQELLVIDSELKELLDLAFDGKPKFDLLIEKFQNMSPAQCNRLTRLLNDELKRGRILNYGQNKLDFLAIDNFHAKLDKYLSEHEEISDDDRNTLKEINKVFTSNVGISVNKALKAHKNEPKTLDEMTLHIYQSILNDEMSVSSLNKSVEKCIPMLLDQAMIISQGKYDFGVEDVFSLLKRSFVRTAQFLRPDQAQKIMNFFNRPKVQEYFGKMLWINSNIQKVVNECEPLNRNLSEGFFRVIRGKATNSFQIINTMVTSLNVVLPKGEDGSIQTKKAMENIEEYSQSEELGDNNFEIDTLRFYEKLSLDYLLDEMGTFSYQLGNADTVSDELLVNISKYLRNISSKDDDYLQFAVNLLLDSAQHGKIPPLKKSIRWSAEKLNALRNSVQDKLSILNQNIATTSEQVERSTQSYQELIAQDANSIQTIRTGIYRNESRKLLKSYQNNQLACKFLLKLIDTKLAA